MFNKIIKKFLFSDVFNSLGKKPRSVWVEDTMVFEQSFGKQVKTPQGYTHMSSSFTTKKAFFLFYFILFVFIVIIARLFYIQIINGNHYFQIAENNREKKIPIIAERGQIFDRNGIQLTQNVPNFSLVIMPYQLPRDKEKIDFIIERLSQITNKPKEEIKQAIEDFASYWYESIVIYEDLDYETALLVQIAAADLPGINIQRGNKRLYLNGMFLNQENDLKKDELTSISHVLGYESKINKEELDELYSKGYLPSDYIGKIGLEKEYENILRGVYGVTRLEVNALGKEQAVLSETSPVPGDHLQLSIDIEMQNKLEDILGKMLKAKNKTRAAGIVMNPNNGEILALVSLPSFDNNYFSGGISPEIYKSYIENEDAPLFNRAISGSYPSGSTIKPAIAAAALQEKIITSVTSVLSAGGISVGEWFFPDWLSGGHGNVNVRESLAWSVNTFYYYIGGGYKDFIGLGIEKITDYLRLFGFDSRLGIDLPSENKGFLPSKEWKEEEKKEMWYIGDTYNISIGQGYVLVTPLQIASMTSVIANGGTLYRPHILRSAIDALTLKKQDARIDIIRDNIINSEYLKIVRLGMKDCVDYGSCRRLLSVPLDIAGKTGTAQWSSIKTNHAWFTSFAPFQNPQIVVTILIEEGHEGSESALPVAEEFYRWWNVYKRN